MAEKYQEGQQLKGSDGKIYVVVGGVPREQIAGPSVQSGVYRLPKSPEKAAEEERKAGSFAMEEEAAERARRGEKRDVAEFESKKFGELTGRYEGDEVVKRYPTVLRSYDTMLAVASRPNPSKADDNLLITLFSKMKDPTTGVLGGEFETSKDVQSIFEKYKTDLQGLYDPNAGFVSPEARKKFIRAAEQLFESERFGYDATRNRYKQLAESSYYNLDPNAVLGPDFGEAYYPKIQSSYQKLFPETAPGEPSEIAAPRLQVAKGEAFSTEADFQRRKDSAEAWAATQGLPFDQALNQFNATMTAKGYGAAAPNTVEVLQWYEQNRPGDRGAVQWELPVTGVNQDGAPGQLTAAASGLFTGGTAGLAEELVNVFDPVAAAKLEAAKQFSREEFPGTTLTGEIIGGVLSPITRIIPGAPMGAPASEAIKQAAKQGAVYGGLAGAGEAAPDAGLVERIPGAVLGATVGGAAGAAGEKYITPAVTEFTERFIAPTASRLITPSAQQAIPAAEQAGIPLLTSDIVKPRTWFGKWAQETLEKSPVIGTGGARAKQAEAREAAITKLYDDFNAGTAEIDDVTRDFLKVRGEQIGNLTRQKTEVLTKVSGTPVDVTDTLAIIDDGIAKFGGLESYRPLTNKLQSFRNDLMSGDMTQIELTRKAIGDALSDDALKPVSTELKKIVQDIYPALRQDMGRHIQKVGDPGDFAKWRSANEKLSDFATDLEDSTIKRVLAKGTVTAKEAQALLSSKDRNTTARLFDSLSDEGKRNARGVIIQDMVEKAGGIEQLSPAKFTRLLKDSRRKIGVAFEPDEAERLTGLLRALQFTRRADQAAVTTPTGQALMPLLATGLGGAGVYFGGTAGLAGGILAATVGGMRAYETKAVKNLLIALSRTAPGSKSEQNVLGSLAKAITTQTGQEGGEAGQEIGEGMAPPKVPLQ
jgi:hypothetical protein